MRRTISNTEISVSDCYCSRRAGDVQRRQQWPISGFVSGRPRAHSQRAQDKGPGQGYTAGAPYS
eukprot:2578723-Lingulodinium_polyedra.AAC.1